MLISAALACMIQKALERQAWMHTIHIPCVYWVHWYGSYARIMAEMLMWKCVLFLVYHKYAQIHMYIYIYIIRTKTNARHVWARARSIYSCTREQQQRMCPLPTIPTISSWKVMHTVDEWTMPAYIILVYIYTRIHRHGCVCVFASWSGARAYLAEDCLIDYGYISENGTRRK